MRGRISDAIRIALAILFLSPAAVTWTTAGRAPVEQGQDAQPDKPAEQVYKNVQIFKGVPASRLLKAMNFFQASLGVECAHCHVEGAFDSDDKAAKQTARRMIRMVGSAGNFLKEKSVDGTVTCFTCHRGQVKPQIIPPKWKAPAGEKPAPGQEKKPAEAVYKNIQVLKGEPASNWMTVMTFMAASLGVECNYCHVQDQLDKDDKPAKQTARKMLQMVTALNKEFYGGSGPITCYACHQGQPRPKTAPQ
jgi:hypothetical protein